MRLALFILLLTLTCNAQYLQHRRSSFRVSNTSGDGCGIADLLFSWHGESTNVTVGTPVGCSQGALFGTNVSGALISSAQFHDGSSSISAPTAADFFNFGVSADDDIISDSAGTITMWVRFSEWLDGGYCFRLYADANNMIRIQYSGTDDATGREVKLSYYPNSATPVTVTTTAGNMALSTWHLITAKWRQGSSNPSMSIEVDATGAVTDDTDLGAIVGTPLMQIGNVGSKMTSFVDEIKIYGAWK